MSEDGSTESAIWLARIERGLQPQEGEQLRAWLQSPRHRDIIVNAAKLYHGPDVVAVLAELVPVGFGNPPPPMPKPSRKFAIATAICLGLVMAAFPIMIIRGYSRYRQTSGALPRDEQIFDTGVRETRTIRLPDNSQVILNGQSQLYVLYAGSGREATVGHGEVIFDVTRRWPHPIVVFAGGRYIVAQGGRFDLRVLAPHVVELTVLEGSVTVRGLPFHRPASPQEARDFDPRVFADASVGPMQLARLDDTGLTQRTLSAAEVHSQLSWEPEQIVYVSP
ncbi:MAG TPA: FecR domain-containing protein [Steroidobacteraceae bacterium]|nr:FecR domain-containing protein [Steroidobacteraceae bacterium]